MDQLEPLRDLVTIAIKDATALIARLKALDGALTTLVPGLAVMTAAERNAYVAKLCEYDETMPDRLRDLVEGLAAGRPDQHGRRTGLAPATHGASRRGRQSRLIAP